MNQNKLYQNEFLITIALKGIHVNIYRHYHWKKLISLICFLIKLHNIYCTNIMTGCWKDFDKTHLKGKGWGRFAKNRGKGQTVFDRKNHIKHWKKNVRNRGWKKAWHYASNWHYAWNYRIRLYQYLFIEIADTFMQHINTLSPDETDQLDGNIRSNGWGAQSVAEIENSLEFLRIFQMFYYFNRGLLLANGLLPVSDGEIPNRFEKISMETLYELFKDTKSHGLVFLQSLLALNLFFGGDIQTS